MARSKDHQAPDAAAQSPETPNSASKAKKTSRKDKHKKTKDHKEKKHDKKKKKKKDKGKSTEVENTAPNPAVLTPQKETQSKSSSPSKKEAGATPQVQKAPTPQKQQDSTSKKLPASTPQEQSANVPQKQLASTPQKQSVKTITPSRLEVQIPSSSQSRAEYMEVTLDSNDESTPCHNTNPTFLSGLQLLREEVKSPFITKNKELFVPGTPATIRSQAAGKGSSLRKPKSEVIKKEPVNKPLTAEKKKREPSLPKDPAEVVQLSSGVDSDSDIELQAIYDTPKVGRSSKATSPLKQNAVTSGKNIASSGTLDGSDAEIQAPAKMRAKSQPPSVKSSMMAGPRTPTPKKNNQPAKSSVRVTRASASKLDISEPFSLEKVERSRTMSPSPTVKKLGSSKPQQTPKPAAAPGRKPMKKGTPVVVKKTDCIDLTSATTSEDDEECENDKLPNGKSLNPNKLVMQLPVAGLHEGKKRSWDEMHSSSPITENEHPSKKLKLENAISRIVQNSLRKKDNPGNEEETLRQRRRRHSAEAVAYFHLTGWKKLVKHKPSPLATKTRGIMSLFSWTEVRKLKKLLREKAD